VVALTSPSCAVDLHLHPFRLVGSGLSTDDLLSRAVATRFLDLAVRVLAPADEILLLLVHAAAHGFVHPKWLLDLHAAARVFPQGEWEVAAERAARSRVTRAFWAAARLVPGVPREVARSLRPPASMRPILRQLVAPALRVPWQAPSRLRAYALAWMLEDRPAVRARRLAGVLERRLRARPSAVAASARWIEGACRAGALPPSWLTIRGESMAPTLLDGDRLLVAPYAKGEAPQQGEIVIACRAGRLVAHRVVARGSQVVTRGDACRRDDPPLPAADVLARVVAIDHVGQLSRGGDA
jgi:hypothetical protein